MFSKTSPLQRPALPTTPQQHQTWQTELTAANNSGLWFDLSGRDEITLTGNDRHTFLHGFCTHEIKNLAPGHGCEAFIPTIKGKALGHVFVWAEPDCLRLDSVPESTAALLPHLDRYLITEDVQLQPTHADRCLFYVTGPLAWTCLQSASNPTAPPAQRQTTTLTFHGVPVQIWRADWFQTPDFSHPGILLRAAAANRDAIQAALQNSSLTAGTAATWETLRLNAQFPEYSLDFTAEYLAQEVDRTAQAISFRKGCYLGQEPIARIDALGHVNRLLRGFSIDHWTGSPEDLIGAELFALPEAASSNAPAASPPKVIGTLTSIAQAPELVSHATSADAAGTESGNESATAPNTSAAAPRWLGLGTIRREFAAAGPEIELRSGDQQGRARVRPR